MNWLDILLLLILAISVLSGLRKGFVRTAIGLCAFVAGLICGLWFHGTVGAYFFTFLGSQRLADIIGFCVILIAFMLAGGLVAGLLARLLKLIHLSWLDRLAGGAFGIVRGVLFGAMIVLLLVAFSTKESPASVENSRTAPYFMQGSRAIAIAAPHDVRDEFRQGYGKIKKFWAEAAKHSSEKPEQREY
jgi:membrane protein required for colicin V production